MQPIFQNPFESFSSRREVEKYLIDTALAYGGAKNRAQAEQWIDFMLGTTFQEDIPLKMFVFPANSRAALPDVFVRFAQIPANPVMVDPAAIEANREAWIEAWTQVVRR